MWVIDRSTLIILGVALAIVTLAGLLILLPSPEPTSSAEIPVPGETAAAPAPSPQPVVVAESEPEPTPTSAAAPTATVEPASSTPIVDGAIHTGEYAHAMEAGGFRVYWSNDANVLRVGLFSPTTGYMAIGLDPDQRMKGANIIIGAIRNGQLVIRDDVGTGLLSHGPDIANGGTEDILAAAGREQNGETTIEFVIPLDSGDPCDKPLRPGATYKVLVAFHTTNDNFSVRHSQRGSGEIRLDSAPS
jgi:hypothetical protein